MVAGPRDFGGGRIGLVRLAVRSACLDTSRARGFASRVAAKVLLLERRSFSGGVHPQLAAFLARLLLRHITTTEREGSSAQIWWSRLDATRKGCPPAVDGCCDPPPLTSWNWAYGGRESSVQTQATEGFAR